LNGNKIWVTNGPVADVIIVYWGVVQEIWKLSKEKKKMQAH
jgi:hypothetical protein